MTEVVKELISKRMPQLQPTVFNGIAAIQDCMANKLLKDDVKHYIITHSGISDVDINNQQQLTQYCEHCLELGFHLFFNDDGSVQFWLKEKLKCLGFDHYNNFSDQEKIAVLDAYLHQAIESAIVKCFAHQSNFFERRMAARKVYKEILGLPDRQTRCKKNPNVNLSSIIQQFRLAKPQLAANDTPSTDQKIDFFPNLFPILIHDNVPNSGHIKDSSIGAMKNLLTNTLIQGRAFEYVLSRTDIVNVDVEDPDEINQLCETGIALGLELLFTPDGEFQPWLNRIFAHLGYKTSVSLSDRDKRSILDIFSYIAIEKGMTRIFGKTHADDIYFIKMHARTVCKEIIGLRDRQTDVQENPNITLQSLISDYYPKL